MTSYIAVVPESIDARDALAPDELGGCPPMLVRGAWCGHEAHRKWCAPGDYNPDCYMCGDDPQRAVVLMEGESTRPLGMAWLASQLGPPWASDNLQALLDRASQRGSGFAVLMVREGDLPNGRYLDGAWLNMSDGEP